jgi:hypothetical protein
MWRGFNWQPDLPKAVVMRGTVRETILPNGLAGYARTCRCTLGRAHRWTLRQAHRHTRSGERIAIAAYLGKSERFDHAIAEFAAAYADLNERDHGLSCSRSPTERSPPPKGSSGRTCPVV